MKHKNSQDCLGVKVNNANKGSDILTSDALPDRVSSQQTSSASYRRVRPYNHSCDSRNYKGLLKESKGSPADNIHWGIMCDKCHKMLNLNYVEDIVNAIRKESSK